jgi:hypothetical protein
MSNRANAQFSIGPRPEEGKAKSSMNAIDRWLASFRTPRKEQKAA